MTEQEQEQELAAPVLHGRRFEGHSHPVDVLQVEPHLLTPNDLRKGIEEIKSLRSGWLDGEDGRGPEGDALDALGDVLIELHEQEKLPLPYLYPTPEGCVEAEWTIKSWEVSATIDPATGDTDLDAVDTSGEASEEQHANVQTPQGRLTLVRFIGDRGCQYPT